MWTKANVTPPDSSVCRWAFKSASVSRQNVQPVCRRRTTNVGFVQDKAERVAPRWLSTLVNARARSVLFVVDESACRLNA